MRHFIFPKFHQCLHDNDTMSNQSTTLLLFFKNTCSLSQLGVEVYPTTGPHKFKSDDMSDVTTGWG